jgi:hypothetical protein
LRNRIKPYNDFRCEIFKFEFQSLAVGLEQRVLIAVVSRIVRSSTRCHQGDEVSANQKEKFTSHRVSNDDNDRRSKDDSDGGGYGDVDRKFGIEPWIQP